MKTVQTQIYKTSNALTITNVRGKTVELFSFDDGDVEIEVEDEYESARIAIDRDSVVALRDWLNRHLEKKEI